MFSFIESMPLIVVMLFLVIGFAFLVKGADYFVEGSSSIAKRFHVPSIIIGLTVVAMGTSLPETAVSVTASIANNNELAISNAVGSNIFNLMVVIGVCAIMTPVLVHKDTLKRDFPFSIFCAVLLLTLGLLGSRILGHVDGIILLLIFIIYIITLVRVAQKASNNHVSIVEEAKEEEADEIVELPIVKSLIFIVLGGAAIAFGGDMVVNTASKIAVSFGMSQTLVGLTIVSIGTSLPELVTSIVAARKNEVDMALGNAIGSNVFNILMVLGIAAAISPIGFGMENLIDVIVLIVFSLFVCLMGWMRKTLSKKEGFLMLAVYAAYAIYIFIR